MALPTLKDLPKKQLLGLLEAIGINNFLTEKEVAAAGISHLMAQQDAIVKRVRRQQGQCPKRLTKKQANNLLTRYKNLKRRIDDMANEYVQKYGEGPANTQRLKEV